MSNQIADEEKKKSFIKAEDTDDNISIKNKEKIKKSNKSKIIILKNNYINILIILLIQILIVLVNSDEVDISSRYEMTIIIGG